MEQHRHHKSGRRGATSIDMQDSHVVFEKIGLKQGESFLDLGCGSGEYSYLAAREVGEKGKVIALDRWEGLTQVINKKAKENSLYNVEAINADITKELPVPGNSFDACLLATVLHTIHPQDRKIELFKRIRQVLKTKGRLVTIDVKKEEHPFGPPMDLRSSPKELESIAESCDFKKIDYIEFEHTYLVIFSPRADS